MTEENKEVKETTEVLEEQKVDKGKELVENLKAKAEEHKWNGKGLHGFLKFLLIVAIIVVSFVELYAFVWPKVEHNFPENIPVEEKCKKAECPKSCNGECSCTYVNKFNKEENITCVVEG